MPAFECLYYLDSFYLHIIEVRPTGLAENSPTSEKCKWLRIEKESREVSPLNFRSKDSSGEIEERFFDEGFLKFNGNLGTYIEKYNSAQHALKNLGCEALPAEVSSAIDQYLLALQAEA